MSVSEDGSELIRRMNAIRNASETHVADLHQEAQRLGDWREYVRAHPLLAFAAATMVGFSLTHRSLRPQPAASVSDAPSASAASTRATATAPPASLTAGAMAMVGSLASVALRTYATNYIRKAFEGTSHDRSTTRHSDKPNGR